jgi:chemotaxis protein histidine kinase CheA
MSLNLRVSKFISGATVLGDGRVVLIPDVLSLFQL